MRVLPLLFASVLMPFTSAQEMHHGKGHQHHDRSAAEWERVLENPERDAWQRPAAVVQALALSEGDTAADIGAGTGYFTVRLAQAVGSGGKVYAVDVQQDLIDHLGLRAAEASLTQVEPVLGAFDDPRLPADSVDLIFICDVVHHIENRQPYYAKLKAALAEGGRLAIVDFYKKDLPVGPGPQMKIAKQAMIDELGAAGFTLQQDIDLLDYQYFLIFRAGS